MNCKCIDRNERRKILFYASMSFEILHMKNKVNIYCKQLSHLDNVS